MALDRRIKYENEVREISPQIHSDLMRVGRALMGIKERLRSILGLVVFLWLLLRLDLRSFVRLIFLKILLWGLPKSPMRISSSVPPNA